MIKFSKLIKQRKTQILIIVLLTILAYSNIFQNSFMLDDVSFIVNWPQIRSFDNLPSLLKGEVPAIHQGVYRPIRSVLYLVYYQLWGVNPALYHLHSMLVHLISTILVYLIIEQLTKKRGIAFVGGLLFGLHPVHTEAITYISASMEMTGVVFFLLAFLMYLRSLTHAKSDLVRLVSYFFALLAFFTYEMTLTLPLIIVLYDICFKRDTLKNLGVKLKLWLPYFLGVGIFLFIRMGIFKIPFARGDYLGFSFYHTMIMMSKVIVKYIWMLISPINVSYLHDLAPGFETFMTPHSNISSILNQSIFDLEILASLIILVLMVIIVIKSYKKNSLISFSLGWFFISLIPVSYIFPQGIAMADKYLYIGSIGFVLFMAVFINWFMEKKKLYQDPVKILLVILVVFYGSWTFYLNSTWKNPTVFWSHLETQHPQSSLVTYTLGVLYGNEQNFNKAADYYLKTISLDPRFWEAQFNLGNIYLREGKLDLAEQQYNKVVMINPDFAPAKANLEQILKREQENE